MNNTPHPEVRGNWWGY